MFPFAFSPCPNDTFAFDAIVNRKILSPYRFIPHLHDIDELNNKALKTVYPISKVSAFCLGQITDNYALLPVGAAIGFDMGPKLVAKQAVDLKKATIAVPGFLTTANLLLHLLETDPKRVIALPYNQICDAISEGRCDAGVIIHESRFTYPEKGLIELADLGALFTTHFNCPLPLGVVVAKRSLGAKVFQLITETLSHSLQFAKQHPQATYEYVEKYATETNRDVIDKHIALYVNQETYNMSKTGYKALEMLFELAIDKGLLTKKALHFHE